MKLKIIYLSRHAKNRMRKFGINPGIVNQVLEKPDFVESSIRGRENIRRGENED